MNLRVEMWHLQFHRILSFSSYSLVFVGRDELTSSQRICSLPGILNDPKHAYNKEAGEKGSGVVDATDIAKSLS
jgi:hypothetical protein